MSASAKPAALIVAGGTGGHLYPGIAVGRALRDAARSWDVRFIVRRGDLGREVLAREKFPVDEIPGQGFPRSLSRKAFSFPWTFLQSCCEARNVVRRHEPSAVLGMGGYLSFPVLLAAAWQKVPTYIHEQNVLPGLANRLLARWVRGVAVSFQESESCFRKERRWTTGLPVRQEIGAADRCAARSSFGLDPDRLTFLVFGGSLGARRLNEVVVDAWRRLADSAPAFQVLHVTGPANEAAVRERYRELPVKSVVLGYCHDMPAAYAAADLVISRSGASTVAELMAAGRPAILVPFPFASGNHQLFNAQALERQGQAVTMEERNLTDTSLAERLRGFLMKPSSLSEWVVKAERNPMRDFPKAAASKIAEVIASDALAQGSGKPPSR